MWIPGRAQPDTWDHLLVFSFFLFLATNRQSDTAFSPGTRSEKHFPNLNQYLASEDEDAAAGLRATTRRFSPHFLVTFVNHLSRSLHKNCRRQTDADENDVPEAELSCCPWQPHKSHIYYVLRSCFVPQTCRPETKLLTPSRSFQILPNIIRNVWSHQASQSQILVIEQIMFPHMPDPHDTSFKVSLMFTALLFCIDERPLNCLQNSMKHFKKCQIWKWLEAALQRVDSSV